jgi:HEAT repeat protein
VTPTTASDEVARRRLVAVSGHRGDEALARRSLDDPSGAVRATALGALARMGRLLTADVVAATADPDPAVRRRACDVSRHVGPAAAPAIVAALDDSDGLVIEAACAALGEEGAGAEAVVALCRTATGHEDPLCREAAVAALGAIGDPAGLPAILVATGDRVTVRRRAVLALAPFDGPAVDAALAKARDDRDWQVRQAAEDLSTPS